MFQKSDELPKMNVLFCLHSGAWRVLKVDLVLVLRSFIFELVKGQLFAHSLHKGIYRDLVFVSSRIKHQASSECLVHQPWCLDLVWKSSHVSCLWEYRGRICFCALVRSVFPIWTFWSFASTFSHLLLFYCSEFVAHLNYLFQNESMIIFLQKICYKYLKIYCPM